jgi:UDP-glucose 4-epimerase
VLALKKLAEMKNNIEVYNLGTGCGYSVLEVLKGFEKGLGKGVKYRFV